MRHRAIARSFAAKSGVNAVQHGLVPAGAEPFASNRVFDRSVLLEDVEGHSPKGADVCHDILTFSVRVLGHRLLTLPLPRIDVEEAIEVDSMFSVGGLLNAL
jgi:hypothetical protein